MTALVSVETVLLLALVILVAGLLRSHAEILRRLSAAGSAPALDPAIPAAPAIDRAPGAIAAPAIVGETLDGGAVGLDFTAPAAAPTLLAFLTSSCSICAGFWESLGERRLPPAVQTLIVTRGPERERPARLRSLAPEGLPVVMSSAAWEAYAVPGAPYFVLVHGEIRGEGVATSWPALASLVSDAIQDQGVSPPPADAGSRRARAVEDALAAAGIGPDHPSLYPGARPPAAPGGP